MLYSEHNTKMGLLVINPDPTRWSRKRSTMRARCKTVDGCQCAPLSRSLLQRLPVDGEVSLGNILEAMENLAIVDAAVGAAQPELSQVTGNDCAIGISPRGHDSTSDPGTSSAIALRSSVASLR